VYTLYIMRSISDVGVQDLYAIYATYNIQKAADRSIEMPPVAVPRVLRVVTAPHRRRVYCNLYSGGESVIM
jgi:hypothetical protein